MESDEEINPAEIPADPIVPFNYDSVASKVPEISRESNDVYGHFQEALQKGMLSQIEYNSLKSLSKEVKMYRQNNPTMPTSSVKQFMINKLENLFGPERSVNIMQIVNTKRKEPLKHSIPKSNLSEADNSDIPQPKKRGRKPGQTAAVGRLAVPTMDDALEISTDSASTMSLSSDEENDISNTTFNRNNNAINTNTNTNTSISLKEDDSQLKQKRKYIKKREQINNKVLQAKLAAEMEEEESDQDSASDNEKAHKKQDLPKDFGPAMNRDTSSQNVFKNVSPDHAPSKKRSSTDLENLIVPSKSHKIAAVNDELGLVEIDKSKSLLTEMGMNLVSERSVEASLLKQEDIAEEELNAKDSLRTEMADRVMSGLGYASNNNSKSTTAALKKNLLEAGNIINKAKFEGIAQNTLLPTGFKIREEAVELISNAIQQLAKNVLESAIVNNRRRRGTYVVNAYNNIQQVLSRYNGSVIPECRMNIGIKWEADKKSQLKDDIEKSNNSLKSKLDELEQALLKRMKEFDEERSIVGRKKPPLPGQERFQELWWVRDREMESEGKYNRNQIELAHFKLDIAKKHCVGPYDKKKKLKPNDDPVSSTDIETQQIEALKNQSGAYMNPAPLSFNTPCPMKYSSEDILTKSDILPVISRTVFANNGNNYKAGIEKCIVKANMINPSNNYIENESDSDRKLTFQRFDHLPVKRGRKPINRNISSNGSTTIDQTN